MDYPEKSATAPMPSMAAEQELPILDRLARVEQAMNDERMRRQEWESIVDGRLSRMERAIGLDDRPHLVRAGR